MPDEKQEVLVIRGRLDRAGRFSPRRCRSTPHVRAWPVIEDRSVRVELLDESDAVLHREWAERRPDTACAPGDAQTFRILAYIGLRPEAVKIRLVSEDIVLWSAKLPPPAELAVDLSAAPRRSGPLTLRLRYSEPGEGAFVVVVYQWGQRRFRVVHIGPPEPKIVFSRESFPGGEQCLFAVTYSNGLRSAQAATRPFGLPLRGPEIAILRPTQRETVTARLPLVLQAAITDPERLGGPRPAEDIVWFVDGEQAARGLIASVDGLAPGTHEIAAVYEPSANTRAIIGVVARESKVPLAADWPEWDAIGGDLIQKP